MCSFLRFIFTIIGCSLDHIPSFDWFIWLSWCYNDFLFVLETVVMRVRMNQIWSERLKIRIEDSKALANGIKNRDKGDNRESISETKKIFSLFRSELRMGNFSQSWKRVLVQSNK